MPPKYLHFEPYFYTQHVFFFNPNHTQSTNETQISLSCHNGVICLPSLRESVGVLFWKINSTGTFGS